MMIFSRLSFLHAHREASALANEIPEESGQFRFLRVNPVLLSLCHALFVGDVLFHFQFRPLF
jgi:hypothetical protein